MAGNSLFSEDPAPDWPSRGGAMSEEEYRELERLNPDRKYEYIAGRAYMMSGGTVDHDLIANNIRASLRAQLRSGPCNTFGENIQQVLVGTKKGGRKHFVYPGMTVSCNAEDRRKGNTLIMFPKIVIEVLSPSTEARDRGDTVELASINVHVDIEELYQDLQFALDGDEEDDDDDDE